MKKIALAAVALLLLISMVGCGTFGYNIKSYVKVADYNNGDVVFVDKDKLDKAVKEAVDNLIDSYPEIKDKTEGTIAKDDTVLLEPNFLRIYQHHNLICLHILHQFSNMQRNL